MERNALATNRLALAQLSVALTCIGFVLRFLQAIAESYSRSTAYNAYWIGAGPLPGPSRDEAGRR